MIFLKGHAVKNKKHLRTKNLAQSPILGTLDTIDINNIPECGVIASIPCNQISRDENQPRTTFHKYAMEELSESIKSIGLQQYPFVLFWKMEGNKMLFKLRAGERRHRAHLMNGSPEMVCVIKSGVYSEKYDDLQALAQAAENNSREPHTIPELVCLVRNVVAGEKERRQKAGLPERGSVDVALHRVEEALGYKPGWAKNYYQLTHLADSLLAMLDVDDTGKKADLVWGDAISLATAPKEAQEEILAKALKLFPENPRARRTHIAKVARALRTARGDKVKGRTYDDKLRFMNFSIQIRKLGESANEGRSREEQKVYVNGMLAKMGIAEIEQLLRDLRPGITPFFDLLKATTAAREQKLVASGLKFIEPDVGDDHGLVTRRVSQSKPTSRVIHGHSYGNGD